MTLRLVQQAGDHAHTCVGDARAVYNFDATPPQKTIPMPLESRLVEHIDQGYVLDITLEDLDFRVYVALRDADIEEVAALVPAERFEREGDVHVAAIEEGDEASEQIQDVLFNLNPGDTIVLLCTNPDAYRHALAELGVTPPSFHPKNSS